MSPQPVQAVFFWRAGMTSVFKATYGRIRPSTTYTKDFHQPRGEQARALERAIGIPEGGESKVEWKWPEGVDEGGKLHPAADFAEMNGRLNLRWSTDHAPPPWRLTPSPDETTLSTLRGTPDLETEAGADAELSLIKASGETPWLIAVHLYGEGPALHARVVLEHPAPGREFASWETLPGAVRRAMQELPSRQPGGYAEFEEGYVVRSGAIVDRIMRAFKENPNVLLVGPPGTGKTVAMDDVRRAFEAGKSITFDPGKLHGAFEETGSGSAADTKVKALVFHPSYTYEDFVMGLLPEPVENLGIGVRPKVGPLLELAHFASQPGRRALLICDEFNRGAAAGIFGDTLALLDVDKRAEPGHPGTGATIETPYAHLKPTTSDGDNLPSLISLPSSLKVLAAMNSADRSVAPLDAALRRRFSIVHVEPDYDVLRAHLGVPDDLALDEPSGWTGPEHVKALAVAILAAINERIEAISGRDFLLGQSVMWQVGGMDRATCLRSLAAAMDSQVMGTLTLSYTDNDAALAAVLNVDPRGEDVAAAAASWHAPGERIAEVAIPRLRPSRFQDFDDDSLVRALASLLE
jgi:5-methylcytosine-specific restriction protein B